jgi:hypothetical protein
MKNVNYYIILEYKEWTPLLTDLHEVSSANMVWDVTERGWVVAQKGWAVAQKGWAVAQKGWVVTEME